MSPTDEIEYAEFRRRQRAVDTYIITDQARLLRLISGDTQVDTAKRLGISSASLSQYELGKVFPTRRHVVVAYYDYLTEKFERHGFIELAEPNP
jgi:transcriptional regulator with XRE-family HTH domain